MSTDTAPKEVTPPDALIGTFDEIRLSLKNQKEQILILASGEEVHEVPPELIAEITRLSQQSLELKSRTRTIVKKGFAFSLEDKLLVLPLAFLQQDDNVAQIMCSCSAKLGLKMSIYKDETIATIKQGKEDVILGLNFAINRPVFTRLVGGKGPRENAFAMGMALRLKGEAKRAQILGALKPNNAFFGNNKDEVTVISKKKIPVVYDLREQIVDSFVDPTAGATFYKVIAATLQELGLGGMDTAAADKFIAAHIKGFDEFVKMNWIAIFEKVSAKERKKIGDRRGVFPSRNSMFLKEELKVIEEVTKKAFMSLEEVREDFFGLLLAHGYSGFCKLLKERYDVRHSILAKLAQVTTKRLQECRVAHPQLSLKKKDVTREKLVPALRKRSSPLESFFEELRSVLPSTLYADCVRHFEISRGLMKDQGSSEISNRIIDTYTQSGVYVAESKNVPTKRVVNLDAEKAKKMEQIARLALSSDGHVCTVMDLLRKTCLQITPESRGLYLRKLIPQLNSLNQKVEEINAISSWDESIAALALGRLIKYDRVSLERLSSLSKIAFPISQAYQKTKKTNTLPQSEDATMRAVCNEVLEALAAIEHFRKV